MRAMVAAFESGEIDAVDDVVHDDYLDHHGLPHDRPIQGVKGFIRVVGAARSGYVDLSVEIADLIGRGDCQVAQTSRGVQAAGSCPIRFEGDRQWIGHPQ